MRRLPFQAIEAFVVVARSLSLTQAAAGMALTVPAVSRRIQLLEQELGVKLFQRLPRGLRLTEAGAAYFQALLPAWDTIRAATEAARAPTGRRTLKVSVMPSFAANWLVPRLGRFQARHHGVEIELETSGELVDLRARPDLDCAIRLGKGPWVGLTSQGLLPVDAYAVAAPAFLAEHGPLRHPRDVLRHALIGSHHQPDFWREWFAAADVDAAGCRYRSFDNLQLVYEAAAAGMGIALGIGPVVRPYVQSGRLLRLFPTDLRLSRQFHLVRRQADDPGDGRFAAFRAWLLAEAGADAATPAH